MKTFACMFDCSRNAVLNLATIKKLIVMIRGFGYNSMMLYTEDTYEVANEPYFGYFRGRYSESELKEIVNYGNQHGIEVIPCIQTLAHVATIFRWVETYGPICDTPDILLAGEKRTYQLIDNIFTTLEKCFTSRTVDIGLDESWALGLGTYLQKHGYTDPKKIYLDHLNKVAEIARKHGFTILMWSDMFVKLAMGGEYYSDQVRFAKPEVRALIPDGVKLMYWEYYHPDVQTYKAMMESHKSLEDDPYFAGGLWTWNGFAPYNKMSIAITESAMKAAKEEGVENILMTLWRDNGSECSFFSALPSIFYAAELKKGIVDLAQIKKDFQKQVGYSFDDFLLLDDVNKITSLDPTYPGNPSKYLLYNDPLCGIFDYKVDKKDDALFEKIGTTLLQKAPTMGEYGYLFESLGHLASLLAIKNSLGARSREAYLTKDKKALVSLLPLYEECSHRLSLFIESFRTLWYRDNKPFGFDVQEIRLGGLALRLQEAKRTIQDYVDGKTSSILEFEVTLLTQHPVNTQYDQKAECLNNWSAIASVNVIG